VKDLGNERGQRGKHEIADRNEILRDKQVCREHDEVEADKKEDCRRQDLQPFVQNPSADPVRDAERFLY
jgi:hypothetical protein